MNNRQKKYKPLYSGHRINRRKKCLTKTRINLGSDYEIQPKYVVIHQTTGKTHIVLLRNSPQCTRAFLLSRLHDHTRTHHTR